MIKVGKRQLSRRSVARGIGVRFPVRFRSRRIEHFLRGTRPESKPFAIGSIGGGRRRERFARLGRRTPHLDLSSRHHHHSKQRVVKASSRLDIAHPVGNLGAARDCRGGTDEEHEYSPTKGLMRGEPTAPHRTESPGSTCCARCLPP